MDASSLPSASLCFLSLSSLVYKNTPSLLLCVSTVSCSLIPTGVQLSLVGGSWYGIRQRTHSVLRVIVGEQVLFLFFSLLTIYFTFLRSGLASRDGSDRSPVTSLNHTWAGFLSVPRIRSGEICRLWFCHVKPDPYHHCVHIRSQILSVFVNDGWLLVCSRLKYLWADVHGPHRMNPDDRLDFLTFPFVSMMWKVFGFSDVFETWRFCPEMQ